MYNKSVDPHQFIFHVCVFLFQMSSKMILSSRLMKKSIKKLKKVGSIKVWIGL